MKKSLKLMAAGLTLTLTGISLFNQYIDKKSTSKNIIKFNNGSYYVGRQGRIYYTRHGSGSPLLLLHDINASSSSAEWSRIERQLTKEHTVYTLDLLGCGHSDKPEITYTSYLYVQMISDFIRDVIGERTDVIASHRTGSCILFADAMDQDLFGKIIIINPHPLYRLKEGQSLTLKLKHFLLELPVIGTFIYNVIHTRSGIDHLFEKVYFKNGAAAPADLKDTFYEAAHTANGKGRFLYASIFCNYTNMDPTHVISACNKSVTLIGSSGIHNNTADMQAYAALNPGFKVIPLYGTMLFPQLENPGEMLKILKQELQ